MTKTANSTQHTFPKCARVCEKTLLGPHRSRARRENKGTTASKSPAKPLPPATPGTARMRQPVPSQSRVEVFGTGGERLALNDRSIDLSAGSTPRAPAIEAVDWGKSQLGRVLCSPGYYDARPPPPRLAAILLLIGTQWAAPGAGPSGWCGAAAAGLSHLRCLPGGGQKPGGPGGPAPVGSRGRPLPRPIR